MKEKKVVTCAEMKALEKAADAAGLSYYSMMENAGACATAIVLGSNVKLLAGGRALVFCGKGNNGGDGFVVARRLAGYDVDVKVYLVDGPAKTPDAITNFELLSGIPNVEVVDMMSAGLPGEAELSEADVIVDAVYGTGFHGQPASCVAQLFDRINSCGTTVVALDIPSGLSGDTDDDRLIHDSQSIHADKTVVFHALKPVHVNRVAREEYMGEIVLANIGIGDAC